MLIWWLDWLAPAVWVVLTVICCCSDDYFVLLCLDVVCFVWLFYSGLFCSFCIVDCVLLFVVRFV